MYLRLIRGVRPILSHILRLLGGLYQCKWVLCTDTNDHNNDHNYNHGRLSTTKIRDLNRTLYQMRRSEFKIECPGKMWSLKFGQFWSKIDVSGKKKRLVKKRNWDFAPKILKSHILSRQTILNYGEGPRLDVLDQVCECKENAYLRQISSHESPYRCDCNPGYTLDIDTNSCIPATTTTTTTAATPAPTCSGRDYEVACRISQKLWCFDFDVWLKFWFLTKIDFYQNLWSKKNPKIAFYHGIRQYFKLFVQGIIITWLQVVIVLPVKANLFIR